MLKVDFGSDDRDTPALDGRMIFSFPRGADGTCAFCHSDPYATHSAPESDIVRYFEQNHQALVCLMCGGHPT